MFAYVGLHQTLKDLKDSHSIPLMGLVEADLGAGVTKLVIVE